MSYRPMRANSHARITPFSAYGTYIARWADATTRQRVASRMNPAEFATVWLGAIVGLVANRASDYYRYSRVGQVVAIAGNGKYLQVAYLSDSPYAGRTVWVFANLYYRIADNANEYALVRKVAELESEVFRYKATVDAEARRNLRTLSQHTVTRALVHAHDNGYCSETAVALISAGHKLPDVTLSLQVTFNVDVSLEGKSSYYQLRKLFGETRGEVDGAYGIRAVEVSDTVQNAIHEQFNTYADIESVTHTGTQVEWHDPVLRLMEFHEAQDELGDSNED
jgi:hypothetical protein